MIPLKTDEVTPSWLQTVFRETGFAPPELAADADIEVIGEGVGFLGDVLRIQVANQSVILKLPTAGDNRKIGQSLGVYEREIRFYREFSNDMPIRVPGFVYADMESIIEPETGLKMIRAINRLPLWLVWLVFRLFNWVGGQNELRFVLMIEDLGQLRRGDQIQGCSVADAKLALAAMARMQGEFLESDRLQAPWIVPIKESIKLTQIAFLQALKNYLQFMGDNLGAREKVLLDWVKDNGVALMQLLAAEPATLVHADFRLDNLFFDDAAQDIVLCDWQTVQAGPIAMDLAYFLSASLVDESAEDIEELLAFYRGELASHGIEVTREKLRWHYEAGMLFMLIRIIPAEFQDLIDLSDERGKVLTQTWLARILAKLQHVDLDRIL